MIASVTRETKNESTRDYIKPMFICNQNPYLHEETREKWILDIYYYYLCKIKNTITYNCQKLRGEPWSKARTMERAAGGRATGLADE